jgi:hypothetical protein
MREQTTALDMIDQSRSDNDDLEEAIRARAAALAADPDSIRTAAEHFIRLSSYYGSSPSSCESCVRNTQCDAMGCSATPLASATQTLVRRFRCCHSHSHSQRPESDEPLHLCNKHGLAITVFRRTCPTKTTVALKNGAVLSNGCPGVTKTCERLSDTPSKRSLRLSRAATRMLLYAEDLQTGEVSAVIGVDIILKHLLDC